MPYSIFLIIKGGLMSGFIGGISPGNSDLNQRFNAEKAYFQKRFDQKNSYGVDDRTLLETTRQKVVSSIEAVNKRYYGAIFDVLSSRGIITISKELIENPDPQIRKSAEKALRGRCDEFLSGSRGKISAEELKTLQNVKSMFDRTLSEETNLLRQVNRKRMEPFVCRLLMLDPKFEVGLNTEKSVLDDRIRNEGAYTPEYRELLQKTKSDSERQLQDIVDRYYGVMWGFAAKKGMVTYGKERIQGPDADASLKERLHADVKSVLLKTTSKDVSPEMQALRTGKKEFDEGIAKVIVKLEEVNLRPDRKTVS